MATITLNITDEQKKFLTDYSNSNNINFNNIFALFIAYMEDIKTIEKIVNDPNTKYSEGMEDLAKECGIDYEAL